MRTLKWILILAVPAVWVAAARPQDKMVPEGTTIKLLLLRQKSVEKELDLSADVIKKVFTFTNKQWDEFQKALKLDKAERQQKAREMRKQNRQFLADNLTAAQQKRLNQITLQVTGLFQLTRPEIVKSLSLTDDQVQEFKKMQMEARKGLEKLLDEKNPAGRSEKLAKHRAETRKKIMSLLTDEQKAKVKELVGKRFTGEIKIEKSPSASKE